MIYDQASDITESATRFFQARRDYLDNAEARMDSELEAAYANAEARQASQTRADSWLNGLGAGDTLPGREQFDYAQMLADGVTPRMTEDGALPLPPRYFTGEIAQGFDLATRRRITADAPVVENEIEAATMALYDPETDPKVARSLLAWLHSQGVDYEPVQEPVRVAALDTGTMTDAPSMWANLGGKFENETRQAAINGLMQVGMSEEGAIRNADKLMPLLSLVDPAIWAEQSLDAASHGRFVEAIMAVLPFMKSAKAAAAVTGVATGMNSGEAEAGSLGAALFSALNKKGGDALKMLSGSGPSRAAKMLDMVDANVPGATAQLDRMPAIPIKVGETDLYITGSGVKHGATGHRKEADAWLNADPSSYRIGMDKQTGEYGVLANGVIARFNEKGNLITFVPWSKRNKYGL